MPNKSLIPDRPEYYVQTGSMFDNPYGVPHEEIMAMILELPSEMSAQVIFGKYVESSGLVFTGETIQMALDRMGTHYLADVPPAPDGRRINWRITGDRWHSGEAVAAAKNMGWDMKRLSFATGVDFARQTDFTVIFTLDLRTFPARVVYFRRLNRVPWDSIYREVGRAVHLFGPSVLADSTGMAGDVIMDNLEDRRYCPIHDRVVTSDAVYCRDRHGQVLGGCPPDYKEYDDADGPAWKRLACVDGFEFQTKSKRNLIEHLRNVLQVGYVAGTDNPFGLIRTPPIVKLEEELSFYAWDDKGLETDTVMALALAAWQGLEDMPKAALLGSVYGR